MTAGAASQNPFACLHGESGGRHSLDTVEPLWGAGGDGEPSPKTPTKDPNSAVPFTGHIKYGSQGKNYKAHQRAKKHNLKRPRKHQNQAWQE